MPRFLKLGLPLIIIIAAAAGTIVVIHNRPPEQQPLIFRYVEEKIQSIVTPKAPTGDLTPVRDLRGTWKSSLPGKGIQANGKFTTGPGITTIYQDGDMEIVIDSVMDNIATGKIRFTNLCVSVQTAAPKIAPVNVKHCTKDTGYLPLGIKVSGNTLDFGTISVPGATASMQGAYTADIMTGNMTVTLPAYGALQGEFRLMRSK